MTNQRTNRQRENPLLAQSLPEWHDWRWQLSHAISNLTDLNTIPAAGMWLADLGEDERSRLDRVMDGYRMGITPYYLNLIRTFDSSDPIFAQIIPSKAEASLSPDELEDPIGDDNPDLNTHPVRVITHRYPDRVLFYPTPMCAVYCRYCFRKRMVGQAAYAPNPTEIAEGMAYITAHPEIREVIFTGGDPLMLPDDRLIKIMREAATIKHIRFLRIHSRLPVVNPFRLTDRLADKLASLGKSVRIVTHFNHAVEVTETAIQWINRLLEHKISVLNQSVLLNGVNADPKLLETLLLKLAEHGIQPYYLHHPDKVKGTGHFRITIARGREIYRELIQRLPGYAVPRYVLDIPGGYGKIPVDNDHVIPVAAGKYRLISPVGIEREYAD
ncbi:MAG: KamA family radical SAM protein [Lentisphaeria bacterium]|nr:KamA family radical SAM protein [Candidatus Neomarinimicrobiota bacterium]MCF7841886.1 KamA family radical SAM protein [Lentisphaeria bacterium]